MIVINKIIGDRLFYLGSALASIANRLRLSESNKKWLRDGGNETLRLNYDELSDDSVVFDIGGYTGQWASDIYSKYRCHIYVFEAIPEYAETIRMRFNKNDKIKVYSFGLSNRDQNIRVKVDRDASSIYKNGSVMIDAQMVNAVEFIRCNDFHKIDLMKINIEGGEYDLLDALIENGLISIIDNIQIQFHDFVHDAEFRMDKIQKLLSNTHKLTYQYPFIFENWKRRVQEEVI
jgi:FkbM family methyltransferase